jgi:hypothetical protein
MPAHPPTQPSAGPFAESISGACAEPLPLAAALLDDGSVDIDALMAGLVADWRSAGLDVRGLLMTRPDGDRSCLGDMVLVDVSTGEGYLVSQALGAGAASCRADPQGFARASRVLHEACDAAPDLVVCNRFGGLEAGGGGFTAELLALMAAGIPVLTAVASRHAEAWQRFTGGAPLLPAESGAARAWVDAALSARATGA